MSPHFHVGSRYSVADNGKFNFSKSVAATAKYHIKYKKVAGEKSRSIFFSVKDASASSRPGVEDGRRERRHDKLGTLAEAKCPHPLRPLIIYHERYCQIACPNSKVRAARVFSGGISSRFPLSGELSTIMPSEKFSLTIYGKQDVLRNEKVRSTTTTITAGYPQKCPP